MGRAKVQARQQTGFPDAAPAGAEVLKQGLGDDPPEQKLFGHAHAGHAQQEPHDAPRGQHIALRAAEQQGVVGVVADECDGVQAHQQTVEEAAAPAAEQADLPGAGQKEAGRQDARRLLQGRQQIVVGHLEVAQDK